MGNIEKFDAMASRYDTEDKDIVAKIIADEIAKNLSDTEGKTLLDYGCGTGLVGLRLLKHFSSAVFVDASQNMVSELEKKLEELEITNAIALCLDLEEKSFKLSADYIIVVQTLLHIKNPEPLIAELFGLLNPGGHLIIVDFDKNEAIISSEVHNGFVQSELICALKSIGFSDASAYTFYSGEKLFMRTDASLFLLDAEK
ncbi:class I SAM-dependent methyltransferase [Clostridiaceae bacterium OttesenSCG-928-D20]|nr:class I SAM-dependent methyltransferase [Clostridiaceae bacterium OttesenSCG-928-D20]